MLAKVHSDFARERLAPHFVYESYDSESGLFFNRASVGFVLIANPLVGANVQAQGEIAEFIKDEENLPADSSLQVLMIGSNRIENYLDNWQQYRKEELFAEMARKRTEFLTKKAEEGIVKDVILLISVTVPSSSANLDEMISRRESLQNTLSSIGLHTKSLNDKALLGWLRIIFGWSDKEEYPDVNPFEILSEQILRPDFSMHEKDDMILISDNQAITTLEVVKRPKEWKLNLMDLFIGNELRRGEYIKCNFMIHLGVHILPNQGMLKAGALGRREAIVRNFQAGMDKLFPDLRDEYDDLNAAVNSLLVNNRMINLHMNVILSDKPNKIKEMTHNYQAMMRRNGFHFVPCKYDHLAVLLNSLPMHMVEEEKGIVGSKVGGSSLDLRNMGRGLKTVSNEVNALLPIIGEWKGDLNSPGMLLAGPRGQIMYWSPFGKDLIPNLRKREGGDQTYDYNCCVAGVPGSGKSVALQEMMWSTLGVGGKGFVMDLGRSFKHGCLAAKRGIQTNYIEFDTKNPISINPFSEIPEDNSPESNEIRADFLGSFPFVLGVMAAPRYGTNDLQQAMLQKAIVEAWNLKKRQTEITDIAGWLVNRSELYAKELGNMLFPYTREGQYGRFFSGQAELSLRARLTVVEADDLRNFPDLMSVITQMIMVHINRTMAKEDRDIPNMFIVDEMTQTLPTQHAGKFMARQARLFRKYNNSLVTATQHLTDYFPKEGGSFEEIFKLSSHKLIFKQTPESLKAMQSNSNLSHYVDNDWKLKLMQSVHSVKHQYSEAAIFGPNSNWVVGRLYIDPFSLLMMSTDANDYQAIENRLEGGMGLTEAIEDILRGRLAA